MSDKPQLESATFTFHQGGNCTGSTDYAEVLTISFESSLGLDYDGDGFFVLRTDGWSVDNAQELQDVFDRIKAVVNTQSVKPNNPKV